MNAQPEHFHEELERMRRGAHDPHLRGDDPEVKALAALAHSLQGAPSLQVDPEFADRLERHVLSNRASLQRQHAAHRRWGAILPHPFHAHPLLAGALSLCLVLLLLGTGVLVAAAQVTNPTNPLYALKHWERQAQVSLSGSSADQAELDLQAARDQLNALPDLADAAHAGAYRQTLATFDQQLRSAAQAVNALPADQDRTRLVGELTTLEADARQTLHGLLLGLAVPERQATTDELGRLGDTVPQVTQVDLTLPAHPNGQASISISGEDLQAGAALLVDGRPVPANGSLQNGGYLFTLDWKGNQHPHSIGIMNPDGTTAQTTAITLHSASDSNGNGGGKPTSTPTPHH
jgi:hypothetical protein